MLIDLHEKMCLACILNIPCGLGPFYLHQVSAAVRSRREETSKRGEGTCANFLHALNDDAVPRGGCPAAL